MVVRHGIKSVDQHATLSDYQRQLLLVMTKYCIQIFIVRLFGIVALLIKIAQNVYVMTNLYAAIYRFSCSFFRSSCFID